MDGLTTEVAGVVLTPVADMLRADGYDLDVLVEGLGIRLRVSAGPEACVDCLVPVPVFTTIVRTTLGKAGYQLDAEQISVAYPATED